MDTASPPTAEKTASGYFVIDVVHPRTQEIFWRGCTHHISDRQIQKIAKIVEKLPVRKKPAESDGLI